MPDFKRISLSLTALWLAALACTAPGMTLTPDADAVNTFIAQTMTAAAARTAAAMPPASPTAIPPTLTFTPSVTPTVTFTVTPFSTGTPIVPLISVSVATNCRNGPGKVYGIEGALLVGETAEVLARDPTGKYWYIRNPDSAGEFCWVWGQFATLTGNISVLPIFTPPPTPTPTLTPTPAPNFKLSYASLDHCSEDWWVEVKLENTGTISFRSLGITVRDNDTDMVVANFTDGFTDKNNCLSTTTKDKLDPDRTHVVSAPAFSYDPTGHKLTVTVILCSNTGQSGTCLTKTIKFTP